MFDLVLQTNVYLNTSYVDIKQERGNPSGGRKINLNTSYVDIKLWLLKKVHHKNLYLNTSYVDIKPNASMYNARMAAFKYILC